MGNAFIEIPDILTTANYSMSSYLGTTIIDNLQEEHDLSRGPTLISGHWGEDYGDNSFSGDNKMWSTAGEYQFYTRGQAFSPVSFSNASYWFVASCTSLLDDNAMVKIYISNQAWPTDHNDQHGTVVSEEINFGKGTDISDTANSRFTGTITDLPRSIDGMLYVYILSKNARVAGFGITVEK